jgi:hypothetical protein
MPHRTMGTGCVSSGSGFLPALRASCPKCRNENTLTFLAETIFEQTRSGVEAESHPILFGRFLKAIGVLESETPERGETRDGRDFSTTFGR